MSTPQMSGKSFIEMLLGSGCTFKSYEDEFPNHQRIVEQTNEIIKEVKRIQKAKEN